MTSERSFLFTTPKSGGSRSLVEITGMEIPSRDYSDSDTLKEQTSYLCKLVEETSLAAGSPNYQGFLRDQISYTLGQLNWTKST
jgi:hypothetical protein